MDVEREVFSCGGCYLDLLLTAKGQVILQSTSVGFNGVGCETKIPLDLEP